MSLLKVTILLLILSLGIVFFSYRRQESFDFKETSFKPLKFIQRKKPELKRGVSLPEKFQPPLTEENEPDCQMMKLLGTFLGKTPRDSLAVIKNLPSQTQGNYRIGETVSGWKLFRIDLGEVILSKNAQRCILKLSPQPQEAIIPLNSVERIVNKSALEGKLKSLNQAIKMVSFSPHLEGGKLNGLKINLIREKKLAKRAGIKEGDIITAGLYREADSHKIYQKSSPTPSNPWGDYEYHSPSEPLNINPNNGAVFTGNYNTYGIDSNGDGIYNLLGADIEVNVIEAGDYSIVGVLRSSTGAVITSRSSDDSTIFLGYFLSASGPGLNTISLTFSGEDIYNSGADGVYTIELAILDENGLVIDRRTFKTSAYNHTEFGEVPARMEVLKDYGEDTNGDGLYDYLTVEIDINGLQAMNYRIEGTLYSSTDGKSIDFLNISKYLDSSQIVKLNFDGIKIRKSEINGPYILAISLIDEDEAQIGYEEYNTSTYTYTDFQLPPQKFTGNYSDYGVDTDGDGLFDYLAVEIELEITVAGNYTVEGWLYDSNGKAIETATTTGYLNVGLQLVVLTFNGLSIYQNQVDGPYYMKYLALKGRGIIDFVEDAYTTSGYSFTNFQQPPIPLVP